MGAVAPAGGAERGVHTKYEGERRGKENPTEKEEPGQQKEGASPAGEAIRVFEERQTHDRAMQVVQTRNLRETQLGGVIFGCKHETIEECFNKQLFGLPALHYSYVRNVKAGLPLFLFNYTDRKLHGVFEAASPGQNSIDPYAWSNDGTLRTPFPAQVRICTRTRYQPLFEVQYKKVIQDNYYTHHYFYFELDHAQTRALIALFKSVGPLNFKQVPAVSSKRSLAVPLPSTNRMSSGIPIQKKGTASLKDTNPSSVLSTSLPSTKRVAPVTPHQKKGRANSKDINPFSVLSSSSGIVPDDWVDSDVDSGSVTGTSDSKTDGKTSGELVSDWEDLDDNDFQNQFGADEASQHSSYKSVADGMELMQCNQSVANPVNGERHSSNGDMLVNSHNGIGNGVQNESDGVGVQLERSSILKKLKELVDLRQQAALSSHDFVYSSPDVYVPEEAQVNANLSGQDEYVPEKTQISADLSSQDEYVPEETRVNTSLPSQDEYVAEEIQVNANLPSQDEYVPEETQVNGSFPCQDQKVAEETHVNVDLPIQDQYVPEEAQANASLSTPSHHVPEETQANSSLSNKPLCSTVEDNSSFEQHHAKAELLRIITELAKKADALEKNQIKSDQEIISLKEVVKDSGRKVQQLEYRIDELQFKFDSSLSLQGSTCDNLDMPAIFLIGGYNGVTWLSSLDSFSPKKDILVSLTSMSSARSYASVAAMEGCIFVFGGGDGSSWYNTAECYNTRSNEWMICPCLNHEKGSLAGVSLNGKIYAMGGDGTQTFSEVEMFDPFLGKWICSPSMLQPRFALAAAESSGVIYVSGGFDGSKYLQSAERYDPREGFWVKLPSMKARRGCHAVAVLGEVLYAIGGYDGDSMVSSVEIFDPRLNAWRMGDPMSNPRGYASAVTFDDSLFVLGGLRSNEQILDTVEVYNVNSGWSVPGFNSIGKRSFASAIVM
ncbi:hypothetical protein VPH35_007548 [Triticum aestivum]